MSTRIILAALASLVFCVREVRAQTDSGGALDLPEVFASVERHHLRVVQALASEEVARAELFAARGGFDPYLRIYGAIREGGYYALRQLDVELRQPTPLWGAEVWAGYRVGVGEDDHYPSYYSNRTLDRGEVRAGIRVPLWRDGPLDSRRAARRSAEFGIDAATAGREATLLELRRSAIDAYMAWVAAGRALAVADELHELASTRYRWVAARAEAGAVADVTLLDAERALISRERSRVSAQRKLQGAGLVLSLFVRDEQGDPKVPELHALPAEVSTPPALEPVDLATCHPRLRAARASLERAGVSVDLARAQRAPRIDLRAQASRDFGEGDESLPGTVFEGGVEISLPLALRSARGSLAAAEARARSAEEALRFEGERLRAETRDAELAHATALQNLELSERLVRNVRALADAERRRFEAGASTLFVVNQREQAVASAELQRVDALRDLWAAHARWSQLTACAAPGA